MNEREKKYFKQILRKMGDNQVQWVLEHDYPEWKKELSKEEQTRRMNR